MWDGAKTKIKSFIQSLYELRVIKMTKNVKFLSGSGTLDGSLHKLLSY